MKDPKSIHALAMQRLEEAKVLSNSGFHDGAFYMVGYSVELMLKSRIAELLQIPDLYDNNRPKTGDSMGKFVSTLKSHDLKFLIRVSGLHTKFEIEKAGNQTIMNCNSLLFEKWDENCRYLPCGHCDANDIEKLIELIGEPNNGLLSWIINS